MKLSCSRCAAIFVALLTLFISACGDSNDFEQVYGQQGNPNNQNLAFAGNFLGANNLDNGQTSNLDLTVARSGQATGTLTVSGQQALAQAVTIAPGAYPVTGTVNLTTGAFNLSGSLPGVGNFSISGQLATGNGQGSYTLTVNGQTYTGVIQNASLGAPTPPNSGGGSGDQHLILGGRLSDFVFAAGAAYNGQNPPVNTNSLITGAVVTNSDESNIVTIAISEIVLGGGGAAESTVLTFGIITQDGEEIVEGQSYEVISNQNESGSYVSLSEAVGTTVNSAWVSTANTTGTVTITDLTDTGVELDFNFDNVAPNTEVAGNDAAGAFDVAGHVSADFAPTTP